MADDEAQPAVPTAIAEAWGLRVRPVKGPRPSVSLREIVDAGVRLADADGLGAVSMSKVAAEVGVTAMALYRHVGNKDELLILMVDAALGGPPAALAEATPWREGLDAWGMGLLAAYRNRPWALRVPITTLPPLPNQVMWMEHGLRQLAATELSEIEKLSSILLISNLVRGYAILEQDMGAGAESTTAMFSLVMAQVVGDGRFPALARALSEGALEDDPPETDALWPELRFGLDRALDGIGALIERA